MYINRLFKTKETRYLSAAFYSFPGSFNCYLVTSFELCIFAGHGDLITVDAVNGAFYFLGSHYHAGRTQSESHNHYSSYQFFHDILL